MLHIVLLWYYMKYPLNHISANSIHEQMWSNCYTSMVHFASCDLKVCFPLHFFPKEDTDSRIKPNGSDSLGDKVFHFYLLYIVRKSIRDNKQYKTIDPKKQYKLNHTYHRSMNTICIFK